MLDLAFVRNHLPLLEEKLRQRGLDPKQALGDFRSVDEQRRQLITRIEKMKAQRNEASEEVANLKKAGGDASALIARTRELRERIDQEEKGLGDLDSALEQTL